MCFTVPVTVNSEFALNFSFVIVLKNAVSSCEHGGACFIMRILFFDIGFCLYETVFRSTFLARTAILIRFRTYLVYLRWSVEVPM